MTTTNPVNANIKTPVLRRVCDKLDEQAILSAAGMTTRSFILDGFSPEELRTIKLFVKSFDMYGDYK